MHYLRTITLTLMSSALVAVGQNLSPQILATAGGSGTAGGVQMDWTLGEVATTTISNGTHQLTQGFHQPNVVLLALNLRAFLEGPYNTGTGLMGDALRAGGYIGSTEPYTALGYVHVNDTPGPIDAGVLATTGNDAIVDWVFLQLRDKNNNTQVLATRCALLQRDGDVVDMDGLSPVAFKAPTDDHFIAVFHRNHLGAMTFAPVALSSSPVSVDLTDGSTAMFGTEAQKTVATVQVLWAGDVTAEGTIKYTGSNNDRDPILVRIGGTVPTNVVTGYYQEDVNMDADVKYTGSGNDRDPILVNIGGSVPTNVRTEQLP